MKKYKFGMTAEVCDVNASEFVECNSADGGNYNPYNSDYYNRNPIPRYDGDERITSIPSPYARMHVTDLAFWEYNCGSHLTQSQREARAKDMPGDYRRAMSHCLDIFELLYHADEFDLKAKGITLHKIELISTKSQDVNVQRVLKDETGHLTSIGQYIQTLDLFRDQYMAKLGQRSRNINGFSFDFSSLYILKYNGKTIASTSPFTGFCAKADCNLGDAINIEGRSILSSDPKTWRLLHERSVNFQKFMYVLLKCTHLSDVFENLFHSLEQVANANLQAWNNLVFDVVDEYKKFNIGESLLQKVKGKEIFIRPDGLDCSYLKYLLYLVDSADLTISKEDYDVEVSQRKFNGKFIPWLGVNDILSDALFVLPYDINNNYVVVPYYDNVDNKNKRRCLLPIKQKVLQYFTVEELVDNMSIELRTDGVYTVSLKVHLANGGYTMVRRDYITEGVSFPNGVVVSEDEMNPFAFGVYPFVRSKKNRNIYKVLFYNKFGKDKYDIKFFKQESNGNTSPYIDTECMKNRTNDVETNKNELPVNCEYHHIEASDGLGLAYAELSVTGKGTSLIVPRLRDDIHQLPGQVNVAIDLGTSNTYVAYQYVGGGNNPITEISTCHKTGNDSWNELTFMNEKCSPEDVPSAPNKNREDLYLRETDSSVPTDKWLDSQLCEFIPSKIDVSGINDNDEGYRFPIPSVINFLRKDSEREQIDVNSDYTPLLHYAIPFAYYERGVRGGDTQNYFDVISDGSAFKWYYKFDKSRGQYVTDGRAKACFNAFLNELLFIVRSHLVCKGYDLSQVKLMWSYPLSFYPQLVREYESAWETAYKAVINPNVQNVSNWVLYSNESRTPIFKCLDNPAAVEQLTLLVDIGGGSTDIIGYKNYEPLFVSSFNFAGNSLYLDGQLNSVDSGMMSNTLLYHYLQDLNVLNSDNSQGRKKISKDDNISTIMNYGFAKYPDDFKKIFDNPDMEYMLKLHNAAIIYHIAQLCKIKSPDQPPVTVYLSGNGSKLFELNYQWQQMVKDIFSVVYGDENSSIVDEMQIVKAPHPKAATVHGALIGYNRGTLATNANSSDNQVVLLGNEADCYDVQRGNGGAVVNLDANAKNSIRQNVANFIDAFYDKIYTIALPAVKREETKKALDSIKDEYISAGAGNVLSDSIFFVYIAKIMDKLSYDLKSKKK